MNDKIKLGIIYYEYEFARSRDARQVFELLGITPLFLAFEGHNDRYKLSGHSRWFREVHDGEQTPEYNITIYKNKFGKITIEKVEECDYGTPGSNCYPAALGIVGKGEIRGAETRVKAV